MLHKPDMNKFIIYFFLIISVMLAYWQVNEHDFIHFDDGIYIVQNHYIQSEFTLDGLRWAFSLKPFGWDPLVFVSFMLDYNLYGLNAGGYHFTNLILHLLNTLLLFWLFNHMTGTIWKSAFVASLFALHPLHVESVAWVSERKDVLSGFFWMLTLCLYVYYTEKPLIKRYMLVFWAFAFAIMSKPMVVTLPVIMILLDYWPLNRFTKYKNKMECFWWQLKEKALFFILSFMSTIVTIYIHSKPSLEDFPLSSRTANALISFVTYLEKTFWPFNMAVFYPFPEQIPLYKALGALFLIIFISTAVIIMIKRFPYLFVGWLWYGITILPVLGIIQIANYSMADRYHYLPSIGIAVMMAWGIPDLIRNENIRKRILFPVVIAILLLLVFLTWRQCSYWKDSVSLFSHTLRATKDNHQIYIIRGITYGQYGRYQEAIDDFNQAINLKPHYYIAYNNRGLAYARLGQNLRAIEDYSQAIHLNPDYAKAYYNRAVVYLSMSEKKLGCQDAQKACVLGECAILEQARSKGDCP